MDPREAAAALTESFRSRPISSQIAGAVLDPWAAVSAARVGARGVRAGVRGARAGAEQAGRLAVARPALAGAEPGLSGPMPVVREIPTDAIKVDPARFQFKGLTDTRTGATGKLAQVETFDPRLGGALYTWEDEAGTIWVVNGHHRLELARRTGQPVVNAIVERAADGVTEAQARATGALINIAEGQGTGVDVGKFLRDSGKGADWLRSHGIAPTNRLAARGAALSQLDDSLFNKVVQGQLSEDAGVVIGEGLPGEFANQREVAGLVMGARKELTPRELKALIQEAKGQSVTVTQMTLFGETATEKSTLIARAKLRAWVEDQLAQDHRIFGFVTRAGRPEALARGQTVVDVARGQEMVKESGTALEVFRARTNAIGPINDIMRQGAEEVMKGADTRTVREAVLQRIRDAIDSGVALNAEGFGPSPLGAAGRIGLDAETSAAQQTIEVAPGMAPRTAVQGGFGIGEAPQQVGMELGGRGAPLQPLIPPEGVAAQAEKARLLREGQAALPEAPLGRMTPKPDRYYRSADRPAEFVGPDVSMTRGQLFDAGSPYLIEIRSAKGEAIPHHPGSIRGSFSAADVEQVFVWPEQWSEEFRAARLAADVPELARQFPNARILEVTGDLDNPDNLPFITRVLREPSVPGQALPGPESARTVTAQVPVVGPARAAPVEASRVQIPEAAAPPTARLVEMAEPPRPPGEPPSGITLLADGGAELAPQPVAQRVIDLRPIRTGLSTRDKLNNLASRALRRPVRHDISTPALLERARERATIENAATRLGTANQPRLQVAFVTDDVGRIPSLIHIDPSLPGAPTLADVAARRPLFARYLNTVQNEALDALQQDLRPWRDLFDEVGIGVGERPDVMKGGFYVPRGGAELESMDEPVRFVGAGRRGGKTGAEKPAVFASQSEGIEKGWEYAPVHEALVTYARGAGMRASDAYIARYFKTVTDEAGALLGETPKVRLLRQNPRIAAQMKGLNKELRRLQSLTRRLTKRQLDIIDRFIDDPEFYDLDGLRAALSKAMVVGVRSPQAGLRSQQVAAVLENVRLRIDTMRPAWKKALEKARSAPRGQTMINLPGLENRTFPDEIAATVNDMVRREQRRAGPEAVVLDVTNAANQLYRMTRSTMDNSAPAIQGLLGMASDPAAFAEALRANLLSWWPNGDVILGKFINHFDDVAHASSRFDSIDLTRHGLRWRATSATGSAPRCRPSARWRRCAGATAPVRGSSWRWRSAKASCASAI